MERWHFTAIVWRSEAVRRGGYREKTFRITEAGPQEAEPRWDSFLTFPIAFHPPSCPASHHRITLQWSSKSLWDWVPGTYAVLYHSLSTPHSPLPGPIPAKGSSSVQKPGKLTLQTPRPRLQKICVASQPSYYSFQRLWWNSQTPSTEAAARRSQNCTVIAGPWEVTLCSALPPFAWRRAMRGVRHCHFGLYF